MGDCADLARGLPPGGVDLIVTGPPSPRSYDGAHDDPTGDGYVDWLVGKLAPLMPALAPTGSVVVDLGNTDRPGRSVHAPVSFKAVIALCERLGLELSQEFYTYEPTRGPFPTGRDVASARGVRDAIGLVPWLSTGRPRVDPTRVAKDRSASEGRLRAALEGGFPSNLLAFPAPSTDVGHLTRMRGLGGEPHPTRFADALPRFFIRLLTEPNDLVLDPFAGSNATGAVAQAEGRRWVSFEKDPDRAADSAMRFLSLETPRGEAARIRSTVASGGFERLTEGLFDVCDKENFTPLEQPTLL